jgi:protein-ribulosamine 3-kinase
MVDAAALRRALETATGRRLAEAPVQPFAADTPVAQALRWEGPQGALFVKVAPVASEPGFAAEAQGLEEIAGVGAVAVPSVLAVGACETLAFIALEWLDLVAPTSLVERRLGEQLATLHRVSAPRFGWRSNNTIGPTPQHNRWCDDWVEFFVGQRLAPQLDLAERRGESGTLLDLGRLLCEHAGVLFTSYRPMPSLLHGDLWGGNWGAARDGRPFVFDPAVYYGDREADLAMTHLFGGFGAGFYTAYQSAWPLDPAAGTRRTLYNLYHVLNHAHLFGGDYATQATAMMRRLLAEIGH